MILNQKQSNMILALAVATVHESEAFGLLLLENYWRSGRQEQSYTMRKGYVIKAG
jgi:hypothetical protein